MKSNINDKSSSDFSFKNISCNSESSRDISLVKDSFDKEKVFDVMERAAVEGLCKLYEVSSFYSEDSLVTFSSEEYLESIFRCRCCDSAPNFGLLTTFINYVYTGDASFLEHFYRRKWMTNNCPEDISVAQKEMNNIKGRKVATNGKEVKLPNKSGSKVLKDKKGRKVTENKNEVKLPNKKKKKIAVTEVIKRKKISKALSAVNNGFIGKKRKQEKDDKVKKLKCCDISAEKYIIRLKVDTLTNIKLVPIDINEVDKDEIFLQKQKSSSITVVEFDREAINEIHREKKSLINCSKEERLLTTIDKEEMKVEFIMKDIDKQKRAKFRCNICEKIFTSGHGMKYHIKNVHLEYKKHIIKPFICPNQGCNKKYKNKNGLKYHLSHSHTGC